MAIEFRCSQCGKLLRTGDDTAGRMAQCPECGSQTPIPFPAEETAAKPAEVEIIEPSDSAGSPFGADARQSQAGENPYQSPRHAWPASQHPSSPTYAFNRVVGPATGIIVTGAIGLLLHLASILFSLLVPIPNNPNVQQMPIFFQPAFGVGFAIVQHALGLGLAILLLAGGIKMKRLENYGLSMAASIIAMIPCFSPCCLLGLPIGIWALVVLSDPYVKSSFR